jgi:hypothetical protein
MLPAWATPVTLASEASSRVQWPELPFQAVSADSFDGASASASPIPEPPGNGQPWSTPRTQGS